jgi:uncharacterized membrane protein
LITPERDVGTSEGDQVNESMEAVLDYYAREDEKLSGLQRTLERISCYISKPSFLIYLLLFVLAWIGGNLLIPHYSINAFDPAPFHYLQGLISLGALLATTIVLSKQDRLSRLEEQRAHLDLKVNLLTEQKTTRLIVLLEELRSDLPNVRHRSDLEATEFKHVMNPEQVLATLDERVEAGSLKQTKENTVVVDADGNKL